MPLSLHFFNGEPIIPDMLLSLGGQRAEDLSERRDRAYLVWEFGISIGAICGANPDSRDYGRRASYTAQYDWGRSDAMGRAI